MKPAAELILYLRDVTLSGALEDLLGETHAVETVSDPSQIPQDALLITDHDEVELKNLRKDHSGPVILLGAGDPANGVVLAKPFRINDLLGRIQLLCSNRAAPQQIGAWLFDFVGKQLTGSHGQPAQPLTEKEAEILRYLLQFRNQPVAREELLQQVWGYQAGISTHTLETHIYRLRQKLEQDPSEARILQTAPGGYQLCP